MFHLRSQSVVKDEAEDSCAQGAPLRSYSPPGHKACSRNMSGYSFSRSFNVCQTFFAPVIPDSVAHSSRLRQFLPRGVFPATNLT